MKEHSSGTGSTIKFYCHDCGFSTLMTNMLPMCPDCQSTNIMLLDTVTNTEFKSIQRESRLIINDYWNGESG